MFYVFKLKTKNKNILFTGKGQPPSFAAVSAKSRRLLPVLRFLLSGDYSWFLLQDLINKMNRLLSEGWEGRMRSPATLSRTGTNSISGRTILQALGLKLNDRVVVGNKLGTLRYRIEGLVDYLKQLWWRHLYQGFQRNRFFV